VVSWDIPESTLPSESFARSGLRRPVARALGAIVGSSTNCGVGYVVVMIRRSTILHGIEEEIMRRPITWLAAGTGLALLLIAGADADEKDISLSEVPKPVMEAVKARFVGAEMTGAAQETTDDKLVYEVSLKLKGETIDVLTTPEGRLFLFETRVTAQDLPAPVAKALEAKYPKATYKKVEKLIAVEGTEEKLTHYEVRLVTAANEGREVKLTPTGEIVGEE